MNLFQTGAEKLIYFAGGMGTLLQQRGLQPGELPERWNLTHPEEIQAIHEAYLEAGADILTTCTFGANPYKLKGVQAEFSVKEIVAAAVRNAKAAVQAQGKGLVALDIGPTGKLMKPLGDLTMEDAVESFAEVVRAGAEAGADLIVIETMSDTYELKAAVLAAKENSALPIAATATFDEKSRLLTGADPETVAALLEGLRVDALGINCGLGPEGMVPIVKTMAACTSLPIIANPNAGIPKVVDGQTVFEVGPELFAEQSKALAEAGARVLGGCCGTTPEHIRYVVEKTKTMKPRPAEKKKRTVVSSYTKTVQFGQKPLLIGERINPTGKKRLKQALREHDLGYLLREGTMQQDCGADILDVNVGLPEIDEVKMMCEAVTELQSVIDLPLQIDTSDPAAMEQAMRLYNGKPLVNSVNGKQESMDAVFPLVRKYGGVVIGLTLDENGIPEDAEGRVAIAEKIYKEAATYGIDRHEIIIDPLALTISADSNAGRETLKAVRMIHERGGLTSLGVSNVSFGLPCREAVNSTFFALALEAGLSAAIMNPQSIPMQKAYQSYCTLAGMDAQCADYIAAAECWQAAEATAVPLTAPEQAGVQSGSGMSDAPLLMQAIRKGLKERAVEEVRRLSDTDPMQLIQEQIVPALNEQGKGFEQGTVFLPQLLMSAEAAGAAFEQLKERMPKQESMHSGTIVLATVKGDIHDIGKNIVRVLLENYGFRVMDLGKDVPPETILKAVQETGAPLAGLSALMTTTVPSMAETIRLLHQEAPDCRIVVGGAVLNREYADQIGADCYSPDAMETVRYAEKILG